MKNLLLSMSLALISISAMAQTFESGIGTFETPLGMDTTADIENPVSTVRDERFNRTEVNSPGGGITATAIGNLINVVSEGSNNTVVINATQTNSGNQAVTVDSNGMSRTATSGN